MSGAVAQPSIHVLPPLESGGFQARHGLGIQDHVAAGFCIDMLRGDSLIEVWCETHDDITLIWLKNQSEEVEFAQVKGAELNQLWSVAKLCEREKTGDNPDGNGTSILEKSLANDRCCEPCRFRLISCRPVKDELKLLTYPLDSDYRQSNALKLADLAADVGARIGAFKSANGNGHAFWLSRVVWEEVHSLETVRHRNLTKLAALLQREGVVLFIDQLEELYSRFVGKAHAAAAADWRVALGQKKVTRDSCLTGSEKA